QIRKVLSRGLAVGVLESWLLSRRRNIPDVGHSFQSAERCAGHMTPRITVIRSVHEMEKIRLQWESLCGSGTTIFQDFGWNLLACRTFVEREEPVVVCAEASYGLAIVPAVVRHADQTVRLLGEELFDYRCFLHRGDDSVLADALAELAALHRPL